VRWHYRDAGLLWLFVPAYAIHVAEEWLAGFTTWVAQVGGGAMPAGAFWGINALAMVLLIAGVRAASRAESAGWIAVTIASVAMINTVSHAGGSLLTRSYSPGLISASARSIRRREPWWRAAWCRHSCCTRLST
jgi:hypothetical protein